MSPFTLISLEYMKGSFSSNLCSTDVLLIKSNNASENRVKAMILHCAWTDLHCVALCIVHCVLCTALIRVHWNDRRLITLRWGLWGSSRLKTFNPLTKGGHEGQSDIENWKWQIQLCSSFSLIQFYGYVSIWVHRRLRMYIFGVAVQPCTQRHTQPYKEKHITHLRIQLCLLAGFVFTWHPLAKSASFGAGLLSTCDFPNRKNDNLPFPHCLKRNSTKCAKSWIYIYIL